MKILLGLLLSAFVYSSFASVTLSNIPQGIPLILQYSELSKEAQRQVTCLAENIYFEAASEATIGKIAVAFVTINRVLSNMFPKTICGVVHQKVNGMCQFSWVCDPSAQQKRHVIKHTGLYNDILKLAVEFVHYHRVFEDVTKGALYFHSTSVNPRWRLFKTAQLGNHVFYRHAKDRHEVSTIKRI